MLHNIQHYSRNIAVTIKKCETNYKQLHASLLRLQANVILNVDTL